MKDTSEFKTKIAIIVGLVIAILMVMSLIKMKNEDYQKHDKNNTQSESEVSADHVKHIQDSDHLKNEIMERYYSGGVKDQMKDNYFNIFLKNLLKDPKFTPTRAELNQLNKDLGGVFDKNSALITLSEQSIKMRLFKGMTQNELNEVNEFLKTSAGLHLKRQIESYDELILSELGLLVNQIGDQITAALLKQVTDSPEENKHNPLSENYTEPDFKDIFPELTPEASPGK